MFVDGRYTLQVRDQVDGRLFEYESVPQTSPARVAAASMPAEGARIGFDPWLHGKRLGRGGGKALAAKRRRAGARSRATRSTRSGPTGPSPRRRRRSSTTKRSPAARARPSAPRWPNGSAEKKLDAAVISALDSVAWLLNIRGADVERTPVALSLRDRPRRRHRRLVHRPGKGHARAARAPRQRGARCARATSSPPRSASWPARRSRPIPSARSRRSSPRSRRRAPRRSRLTDPCVLPKAIKNPVEQAGHRAAQARDGAALARFLHWLSVEGAQAAGSTRSPPPTRLHAVPPARPATCATCRSTRSSGAGPNGAIVHYRVSEETNRTLEPGSVYLVDSGGQYPDGTTDVTRTVWIGPGRAAGRGQGPLHPRAQGPHRAGRADVPARAPPVSSSTPWRASLLWQAGLDYAHGTGHGVGSFLAVHEGPQRIAKAARRPGRHRAGAARRA